MEGVLLNMTLKEKCYIIEFAERGDERGNLVVVEGGRFLQPVVWN